jgi:hypothetical protein
LASKTGHIATCDLSILTNDRFNHRRRPLAPDFRARSNKGLAPDQTGTRKQYGFGKDPLEVDVVVYKSLAQINYFNSLFAELSETAILQRGCHLIFLGLQKSIGGKRLNCEDPQGHSRAAGDWRKTLDESRNIQNCPIILSDQR